jgi:cell division protease FtsH
MPDLNGREEILKVHARKVKTAPDVDLNQIARGTPGFTGADLEALVNEAAIRAAIGGKSTVTTENLEEARDKVRFGREKKRSRIMTDEDRKMTAYHEAGHALVALLEESVEPLHKVTIIPRGFSMGMTMILPEKDKYGLRRRECLGTVRMSLAGRIAEAIFCNDISSGAEDDIRTATELVRRMVTQWGMSEELGPVRYSDEERHVFLGNELTQAKRHSDHMAQRIDAEIHRIVSECHDATHALLEEHSTELQNVARALLEMETLTGEEVRAIVDGTTVAELKARRKERDARAEAAACTGEQPEEQEEGPTASGLPRPAGSPA